MTNSTRVAAVLCLTLSSVAGRTALAQSFIYVANAGDDTVSKIDVTLNQVVATYRTWFPSPPHLWYQGAAPSRIAVDATGFYVLDRFFGPNHPNFPCSGGFPACHLPVLIKILHSGGTNTSAGPPLPMIDQNSNSHLEIPFNPVEAQDVRIAWATEIGSSPGDMGALGRALCIGLDGNLWVGLYHTGKYYKVNSTTGAVMGNPILTPGHTPYGCDVDSHGILWSSSEGSSVAEIDTNTGTLTQIWNHPSYGNNYAISLQRGCGKSSKVYLSENVAGRTYISLDPSTGQFSNAPTSIPQFQSNAIAVTSDGNIVSGNAAGGVVKYTPSGTVIWQSGSQTGGYPHGHVHGLIEDPAHNLWTINLFDDSVSKYRGSDGTQLGVVHVGSYPYTYANVSPPNCPCAVVGESSIQCQANGTGGSYSYSFTFTNNSPFPAPATSMVITPSTGVTNLTPASPVTFPPVPPGGQGAIAGTFTVLNGQPGARVCLNVKLQGGGGVDGWCCPSQSVCFVLPECLDCVKVQAQFKCGEAGLYLELTVTNGGPSLVTSVQVSSATPGVTVIPTSTSVSLAPNASTTLQLGISGASPGQSIDIAVSLHGPTDPHTGAFSWCCSQSLKVVYPLRPCRIIGGQVFHDRDRNGSSDYEEDGLAGWTVVLEGGPGGTRTATTDRVGAYGFDGVEPGVYKLTVRNPDSSWRATSPESGSYTVTIDPQTTRRFNFGFVRP